MKKKAKKEPGEATRDSVKKEMAKPRMAKSAREAVFKRSAGRITPAKPAKAKSQSHELPFRRTQGSPRIAPVKEEP
jgi:hypothetical protein